MCTSASGSSPHTRGARRHLHGVGDRRRIIPAYAGSTSLNILSYCVRRDHPRIRGEHIAERQFARPFLRIIPAYAGSTRAYHQDPFGGTDHPRIRGEHMCRAMGITEKNGSSPHTRGARAGRGALLLGCGIIPAYAGSTVEPSEMLTAQKDHPRIRGEHLHIPLREACKRGSSPHTRGALEGWLRSPEARRIIPAYAGSTTGPARWVRIGRGSSPHTRGAQRPAHAGHDHVRIIPAYAGSTREGAGGFPSIPDHPRIRGEHQKRTGGQAVRQGSSPHTRGAHVLGAARAAAGRIIPAYAGSTERRRQEMAVLRDHPRIRGEHLAVHMATSKAAGSSPHTRGARSIRASGAERAGIIPAYAGSTPTGPGREPAPTDHPRIRGEHAPPYPPGVPDERIIPAYAGSTQRT